MISCFFPASGTPKPKPPQNLAENRLKNLLNSINGTGTATSTGAPGKKVVSPDKKLRKIQSASMFLFLLRNTQ